MIHLTVQYNDFVAPIGVLHQFLTCKRMIQNDCTINHPLWKHAMGLFTTAHDQVIALSIAYSFHATQQVSIHISSKIGQEYTQNFGFSLLQCSCSGIWNIVQLFGNGQNFGTRLIGHFVAAIQRI
ncbi:hypothetical protein D3C74_368050 [compost metagenome]